MSKLKGIILCEGRHDLIFLQKLLDHVDGRKNANWGHYSLRQENKAFEFACFNESKDKSKFESFRFTPPKENEVSELSKEFYLKDVNLLSCGGIDNMSSFLKNASEAKKGFYRTIPILAMYDEDPGNEQTQRLRESIDAKLKELNKGFFERVKPFRVEPMLDGLILECLLKPEAVNIEAYPDKEDFQKSFQCYRNFIACLNLSNPSSGHPKHKLQIVELGMKLQKKSRAGTLKGMKIGIIPQVFNYIDYRHQKFEGLREALEQFLGFLE